jgi:hypothetical protein
MKLSEYYHMINQIDKPLWKRIFDWIRGEPKQDSRITIKDLEFNGGKGKEGSATITFLNGVPVYLNWYIWDLDHAWMIQQVEQELGAKIKLFNLSGGNGHEGADLEVLKNDNTSDNS